MPKDCNHSYQFIGTLADNRPVKWCHYCGTILLGQTFTHPRAKDIRCKVCEGRVTTPNEHLVDNIYRCFRFSGER
jgi:hypothetical protein